MSQVNSFAKINFTLEILRKREDGFHEINTIFQEIGLKDTLSFNWNTQNRLLHCDTPAVPLGNDNIILKALAACEELLGHPIHVEITLEKQIPMGAGLGGGSSNAAVVLQEMGRRFAVSKSQLIDIATQLGADVPFFLVGGTALGTGKGEKLKVLPPMPTLSVVIIKPTFSIPTSFAYSLVKNYSSGMASKKFSELLLQGESFKALQYLHNDFEDVLFPHYPPLMTLKKNLLDQGAIAAGLSGSGSAFFAIARDHTHAKALQTSVMNQHETWVTECIPAEGVHSGR